MLMYGFGLWGGDLLDEKNSRKDAVACILLRGNLGHHCHAGGEARVPHQIRFHVQDWLEWEERVLRPAPQATAQGALLQVGFLPHHFVGSHCCKGPPLPKASWQAEGLAQIIALPGSPHRRNRKMKW